MPLKLRKSASVFAGSTTKECRSAPWNLVSHYQTNHPKESRVWDTEAAVWDLEAVVADPEEVGPVEMEMVQVETARDPVETEREMERETVIKGHD